jgi:hypothetical protein
VGELGRDSCFGPLTFPNPSRPFSPNPPLCSRPPFSPPLPPPPSHLLFFQTLEATHQTLAPPISSSQGAFRCRSDLHRVVQIFDCFRWREEGRKEMGRTQGDFCVYLLFICAAIQLFRCCVCDWVEGLSRILGGGRTAAVLVVSGHFSWRINGNQFGNHVELWHTFPTSIYALNLEL